MVFDKTALATLEKTQTMKDITRFLLENPKTMISAIRESIKNELYDRGIIGKQTKIEGGETLSYDLDMHNDDYLLINECIYDLLYKRVLSPGINANNLDLPYVHVSDNEKLKQYL